MRKRWGRYARASRLVFSFVVGIPLVERNFGSAVVKIQCTEDVIVVIVAVVITVVVIIVFVDVLVLFAELAFQSDNPALQGLDAPLLGATRETMRTDFTYDSRVGAVAARRPPPVASQLLPPALLAC